MLLNEYIKSNTNFYFIYFNIKIIKKIVELTKIWFIIN